jgi:putative ABC transport system permease protein
MRPSLNLFWRLMIRPLAREPVRIVLTILAVSLGVAVVLAMDLAGDAATGSFHSSLETLSGRQDFELTAIGGVPEELVGKLSLLPHDWQITPRIEGFVVLSGSNRALPLVGLDLIGAGNRPGDQTAAPLPLGPSEFTLQDLAQPDSVWVGRSLGKRRGDAVPLLVNDRSFVATVRGTYPDSGQSALIMDIAAAQSALQRKGFVDRVLIRLPKDSSASLAEWRQRIEQVLPARVQLRAAGASTDENRRMLGAFRWNLRLLSYIALVVGAFLIYNTISVSVVRRRAEIGVVRALGASRAQVLSAFLLEAAFVGVSGSLLGIPVGRLIASFAVKLMGATVNSLYVSSRPGEISLGSWSIFFALLTGLTITLLSAWAPAREAAKVPPVEAMARARREFEIRVNRKSALAAAGIFAAVAAAVSRLPPVGGKPVFGYFAALLAVAAGVFAIPIATDLAMRVSSRVLPKLLRVEALLASRSLSGSLRRTTVLVAALSTAISMTTAVGIMVGSFRQTVIAWMNSELPADFYLRPAGNPATDQHPVISPDFADGLRMLPGVRAVQRLRAYEISYQGMPATLGAIDLSDAKIEHSSDFLSGRTAAEVLPELRGVNAAIVSEPFSYKHHIRRGDSIHLDLGDSPAAFRVADVYYDYSSERGAILVDRDVMLHFLPDRAPSNIAVFVSLGANQATVRREIEDRAAATGAHVLVFANTDLRRQAVEIFDRTFAITYALEAIAVLVAIMGVAGALLALIIDRRRELGLLRYLGASSAQLRKLILTEAGLLGLLANFSGLLLGILLSLILIFVINKQSFGWTIRFHWPIAVLLEAISLVWTATVLAACYPAEVAVRLNPIEVIHED